jgi:hypothetical protein
MISAATLLDQVKDSVKKVTAIHPGKITNVTPNSPAEQLVANLYGLFSWGMYPGLCPWHFFLNLERCDTAQAKFASSLIFLVRTSVPDETDRKKGFVFLRLALNDSALIGAMELLLEDEDTLRACYTEDAFIRIGSLWEDFVAVMAPVGGPPLSARTPGEHPECAIKMLLDVCPHDENCCEPPYEPNKVVQPALKVEVKRVPKKRATTVVRRSTIIRKPSPQPSGELGTPSVRSPQVLSPSADDSEAVSPMLVSPRSPTDPTPADKVDGSEADGLTTSPSDERKDEAVSGEKTNPGVSIPYTDPHSNRGFLSFLVKSDVVVPMYQPLEVSDESRDIRKTLDEWREKRTGANLFASFTRNILSQPPPSEETAAADAEQNGKEAEHEDKAFEAYLASYRQRLEDREADLKRRKQKILSASK